MPLTLPASWPAANASAGSSIPTTIPPRWSALGGDDDDEGALPPHIHLLALSEPAFPLPSPAAVATATLQLQHLDPTGEPTALTVDLGRLFLLNAPAAAPSSSASVLSVAARTITGAFGENEEDGGGCGAWEWERGARGAASCNVRVTLPPGGFCTLEVRVGREAPGEEGSGSRGGSLATAMQMQQQQLSSASPFAH